MNTSRVKRLLFAVNFGSDHITVRDCGAVWTAGNEVVVMADFIWIRVGLVSLRSPNRVLDGSRFIYRPGRTHIHVIIGVNRLQMGLVASLAGVAPRSIERFQLLPVGITALREEK